MRIAVVVETFPTISETFIVNQILGYLNAGHEVRILAYHKGADSAQGLSFANEKINAWEHI